MNIQDILAKYDAMFGVESLENIENYLVSQIHEARNKKYNDVLFTLLNEMIGFCRDTTQKEKGLYYCTELLEVVVQLGIEDTVEYGTCLLNLGNAYRAFGAFEKSEDFFKQCERIYQNYLVSDDFSFANLYNNWALLYQETNDFKKAVIFLNKALEIVQHYPEETIKQAITRSNLASSLIQLETDESYEKAMQHLMIAIDIFEADGGQDFHYGASLVALGDAYMYKKEYSKASIYYQKGLNEIEKHVGKNENYQRVAKKYRYVESIIGWTSNLEASQTFYEQYGKPMIHQQFPDYENRIAVGMVGEGSDCFGYDDEISKDHDYEVGFCLWLTQEDARHIGAKLQEAYDKLVSHPQNSRLSKRRGVFTINDFYQQLLNTTIDVEKGEKIDLSKISEANLALATNGKVFEDNLGIFSSVRESLLEYYPDEVWHQKIAQGIHDFSQYAQSNYPRMMARKDFLTASLCINKAVETTLDLIYLLERRYAPYYKWKQKGVRSSRLGKKLLEILLEIVQMPLQKDAWEHTEYSSININQKDACVLLFDKIAGILLEELKRYKLAYGEDVFLENYVSQILQSGYLPIVDEIVELEWQQFDQVQNVGGRASCQDDYPTFAIMRKSQYMTWTPELLESYYQDLLEANRRGWNLITEKYARMMASTAPEEYAMIKDQLPPLNGQRLAIQEELIQIQVVWMEEFAVRYPKMANNARVIHTNQDELDDVSYETYLRGEMSTYSDQTFVLYGKLIVEYLSNNKNLTFEVMGNTAKLYGYTSLEHAENNIK